MDTPSPKEKSRKAPFLQTDIDRSVTSLMGKCKKRPPSSIPSQSEVWAALAPPPFQEVGRSRASLTDCAARRSALGWEKKGLQLGGTATLTFQIRDKTRRFVVIEFIKR